MKLNIWNEGDVLRGEKIRRKGYADRGRTRCPRTMHHVIIRGKEMRRMVYYGKDREDFVYRMEDRFW